MAPPTRPFVGRERELAQLVSAIEESRSGAGALWLLAGEPGIGKSRLANEAAREAQQRGMLVLAGHCWEAGGAPTFWPWVQMLRALMRHLGSSAVADRLGARAAHLAALLPELAATEPTVSSQAPALDPDQARFQVLEAVSGLLVDHAAECPLLLLIEDLHAADVSSLLLLDLLARELPRARILAIGTYRTAELDPRSTGPYLARVERAAHHIDLKRIGRDPVTALLERTIGGAVRPDLAAAVDAATEGNPLFVVEMARLLASDPEVGQRVAGRTTLPLPSTVRAALRERIARLDADAREVLQVAAVLGRDFAVPVLAELLQRSEADLEAPLARAAETALVGRVGPSVRRFSHILIREVLHDELPDERRFGLHRQRAERLAGASGWGSPASWSEIAHHWLEAGPSARREAEQALVRAAEEATARMAFDDAALALEHALGCLDSSSSPSPAEGTRRRYQIALALGHARNLAGDVLAARESCVAAAALARSLADPERFAMAVLEYGAVFVHGNVDPLLLSLLQEALGALPPGDGPLRARLMARYAAALQPSPDPLEPGKLAREAIAMARRVGEPHTLLATLRDACGGFMDVEAPEERLAINRETVELALHLGEPVYALRGTMRIVFDEFERGEVAAAHAAIDAAERMAERLAHPHYRWPIAGLRAMCATREGRFADARRWLAAARELADGARDPNAFRALTLHEMCRLRIEGRDDEVRALLPELVRGAAGSWFAETLTRIWAAVLGLGPEMCGPMTDADMAVAVASIDSSLIRTLIEVATQRRDEPTLAAIAQVLGPRAHRVVSWGIFGFSVEGPVSALLGRVAAARGRIAEARELFEDALARARTMGARPHAAWIAHHLGCAIAEGAGDARGKARELLELARSEALAMDMPGLVAKATARLGALGASSPATSARGTAIAAPPSSPAGVRMTLAGELWTIEHGAARVLMRDTKGLRMLAALVDRPGTDWHVLDLSRPEGAPAAAQGGLGATLDARARADYRERISTLRAEIEEAASWNDPSRAERAHAELDAITAQLERAMGLGGRARRSGADAERARVNVQRRVRDAIRRIGEQDHALARHLERSVRTGTLCRYDPE